MQVLLITPFCLANADHLARNGKGNSNQSTDNCGSQCTLFRVDNDTHTYSQTANDGNN